MTDPWTWTVEDVATNFCRSEAWASAVGRSQSDQAKLEETFRINLVDGPTLLDQINGQVLKDGFKVNAFGTRAAIVRAIERLRESSPGYADHRANIEAVQRRVRAKASEASPAATPFQGPQHSPVVPSIETNESRTASEQLRLTPPATEDNTSPVSAVHQVTADGRKRRRIQPTTLTTAPITRRTLDESFLGRSKSRLDDVFYGNDLDSSDGEDFSVVHTTVPDGRRAFVKQRIQHLLSSRPAFESDSRAVLLPYPDRLVKEGNPRSATVFTASNGTASAVRRNALFVNTNLEDEPESEEQNTDWDYLAKWARGQKDDEVLPLYAESGSENDYDDELLDEIERDAAEETTTSKYLSHDEVQAILDEAIQGYQDIWRDDKLPRRDHHAFKIWQSARGRKSGAVTDDISRRLDHKETRLHTLTREMLGQQWGSKAQLWKQRGSLEATVFDIEEAKWQLSIISGPAPPRTARTYSRRNDTHTRADDEESGDLIESSSSDSEDDFVEVDEYPSQDQAPPLSQQPADDAMMSEDEQPRLEDESVDEDQNAASPGTPSPSEDSVLGAYDRTDIDIKPERSPITLFESGDLIDLTASSQPDPDSDTDPVKIDYSKAPEHATELEISKWPWTVLLECCDRKRIILKLLNEMESVPRKRVEAQFFDFDHERLIDDTGKALKALRAKRSAIVGIDVSSSRTEAMFRVARLWICWTEASNAYIADEVDDDVLGTALYFEDFNAFWKFLRTIINTGDPSESEDEDPITPRKKRTIIKDRQAQQMRQQAQHRARLGVAREMEYKMNTQSSGLDDDLIAPIVNTIREEDEAPIYLHPHIAKRVKPHQLKGIQFMWREVVGSGSELRQGCLLAHTMGLGKTMQTIALLVTIQLAAQSADKRIRKQVPKELQENRTLILCPAVLIDNWQDELSFWLPADEPSIRPIYPVTAKEGLKDRLASIGDWCTFGGVLILSYDMFKRLLSPKIGLGGSTNDDDLQRLRDQLLAGPTMIVADEAHAMKNRSSKIGTLVKQFQSTSRIALTGSPLANNLGEYYAMIDWVAPGYLGDPEEFRALFQNPIEEGTWEDATPTEQRRSLKKLRVLTTDIAPKVDRADITVLKDELTPKTEFVLYLAMTEHQTRSYTALVEAVRSLYFNHTSNMSVFDWMRLLGNLLNHPYLLLSKLQARAKDAKPATAIDHGNAKTGNKTDTEVAQADQASLEAPQNLSNDLSSRLLAQQEAINADEDIANMASSSLSIKARVIARILTESKAVGDQVLVFSHQIPMLNYLERLIPQLPGNIRLDRLDGTTRMDRRLDKIKAFNAGTSDVFLLSTRAAALGLNIASANRVILVDFEFNPSHEEQAVGRAYRIGQKKEVFVYHLITSGTFERKLHDLTIFKRQLALRALDSRNPNRAASKIDTYLFPPHQVEQQDLSSHRNKDKVLDRLLDSEAGTFIRDINTAETMHAEKEEKFTEEEEKEIKALIEDDKLRKRDHAAWSKKQIDEMRVRPAEPARMSTQQMTNLAPPATVTGVPSPIQGLAAAQGPPQPVLPSQVNFDVKTGRGLSNQRQQYYQPTGFRGHAWAGASSSNPPTWLDAPDMAHPPIRGPHSTAPQRGAPANARSRGQFFRHHMPRPEHSSGRITPVHRRQLNAEDDYEGPYPPGARQVNAGFGSAQPNTHQARMLDLQAAKRAREDFMRQQNITPDTAARKEEESKGRSVGDAIDLDSD